MHERVCAGRNHRSQPGICCVFCACVYTQDEKTEISLEEQLERAVIQNKTVGVLDLRRTFDPVEDKHTAALTSIRKELTRRAALTKQANRKKYV